MIDNKIVSTSQYIEGRPSAPNDNLVEESGSVMNVDLSMSGPGVTQTADGKAQGSIKENVSLEEELDLELEGLSLAIGSIQPVDDSKVGNEEDSGYGVKGLLPALGRPTRGPNTHGDNTTLTPSPPPETPQTMDGQGIRCQQDHMACRNGLQCIPVENFCDLVKDCEDGTDEDPSICVSTRNCEAGLFKCGPSAQCVSQVNRCDGIYHCSNGDDEKDCTTCVDRHGKLHVLTPEDFCDGVKDCADGSDERRQRCQLPCAPGYRKCNDGLQCVKEELFCNGIYSCHDMSDEIDCGRTSSDCQVFGMFACDGLCHPMSAVCDSTYDCSSGIDEDGCDP